MTGALHRQLRDFVVAGAFAIVIASIAFIAVRNREVIERQFDLAGRSALAVAADHEPLPTVHGVLVGPSTPSHAHPLLRHRKVHDGGWRTLQASPLHPDDKLFYDAATRFDREHVPFVELLRDGSGRAIAARAHGGEIAVAVTVPIAPAQYPLLVIIGLLGLGAALTTAGALIGGAATRIGAFAGLATLAIPTVLWGSWVAAVAILLVALAVSLLQRAGLTDRLAAGLRAHRTAVGFLAPAGVAMLVLVATPFVLGLVLGFYDHHQGTWSFVGIHNFVEILSGNGRSLDDPLNFWFTLGVTVLWTTCNIMLHVSIGVALALLLSRKWMRAKGVFRMLLILPWAIPNYITALMWHGMFDGQYSAINSILQHLGMHGVSWWTSWLPAFASNVITNTWLGFPFMMVVALGALQNIPAELFEAAAVDGASSWQRFRHITLPHLRPALGPAVALGSIWTFNMFNVIYLVSNGKPGGSTNILVTDAYRWAFERGDRYGMAAAYGTIIFLVLLLWNVIGGRIVRAKGEGV
ncbi:MAG: sugar ABC transporter permease [Kofleriaceae bacterium]